MKERGKKLRKTKRGIKGMRGGGREREGVCLMWLVWEREGESGKERKKNREGEPRG